MKIIMLKLLNIKVNGYKYTWNSADLGTVKYQIIKKNA